MGKIGLIVEGGGMKCAYSAGVLDAFLDEHITFDYAIGVSAGSANAASYLAGQRGRNLRFYTDWTHDPAYFGLKSYLKTGNLFGLHYIYADLTNSDGKDPLDYPALMATNIGWSPPMLPPAHRSISRKVRCIRTITAALWRPAPCPLPASR